MFEQNKGAIPKRYVNKNPVQGRQYLSPGSGRLFHLTQHPEHDRQYRSPENGSFHSAQNRPENATTDRQYVNPGRENAYSGHPYANRQYVDPDLDNAYSGHQYANSGRQYESPGSNNAYSGHQYANRQHADPGLDNAYSGYQYSNPGRQCESPGGNNAYSGHQYASRQFADPDLDNVYSGDQYANSQYTYPGLKNAYSGHQDANPGIQDTYYGHQDKNRSRQDFNSGHQDTNPGIQDTYYGHQDANPGIQDTYYEHQDKNRSRQDFNSGHQDANPGIQDTYYGHQDKNRSRQDFNSGHQEANPGRQDGYSGHQDANRGRQVAIFGPENENENYCGCKNRCNEPRNENPFAGFGSQKVTVTLVRNIYNLFQVVQQSRNSADYLCRFCNNTADDICIHCGKYLCDFCSKYHAKDGEEFEVLFDPNVSKLHKVVTVMLSVIGVVLFKLSTCSHNFAGGFGMRSTDVNIETVKALKLFYILLVEELRIIQQNNHEISMPIVVKWFAEFDRAKCIWQQTTNSGQHFPKLARFMYDHFWKLTHKPELKYISDTKLFNIPWGVTTDSHGCIYVVDKHNHNLKKFSFTGELIAVSGKQGNGNGEFQNPTGIAYHRILKKLYVVDKDNNRVQVFDLHLQFLQSFGADHLNRPQDIGINELTMQIVITDPQNNSMKVFHSDGTFQFSYRPRRIFAPVFTPRSVCFSRNFEKLYVSGFEENVAYIITDLNNPTNGIRKMENNRDLDILYFFRPQGIACDAWDNIYVANSRNNEVVVLSPYCQPIAKIIADDSLRERKSPQSRSSSSSQGEENAGPRAGDHQYYSSKGPLPIRCGRKVIKVKSLVKPVYLHIDDAGRLIIVDSANTVQILDTQQLRRLIYSPNRCNNYNYDSF